MRIKCSKCNQYGHNSRGCRAGKTQVAKLILLQSN